MNHKIKYLLIVSGLTIGLAGCGQDKDGIAKVGDRTVTQSQFDAYLKVKRVPQQNEPAVLGALEEYLDREAMMDAILAKEVLDQSLVEAEVNEYKKQLLISRYFEKVLEDKVSEQALRNYYNSNIEEFSEKKLRVAHILIRKNSGSSDVERDALRTKAHQAYTEILQGKGFSEIVEKYSQDMATVKKGGDLGWLAEGAVAPEFMKVASALDVDEISEPVETNFGFHIIKLLEPAQTVKAPYEKVKGDIRYQLRKAVKEQEAQDLKSLVAIEKL